MSPNPGFRRSCAVVGCIVGIAFSCAAAEWRPVPSDGSGIIIGGNTELAKAALDTIRLMGPTGSGAPYIGDFESGWAGWTHVDLTQPTDTHWQVSGYGQTVPGDMAAWCGDLSFPSCYDSLDVEGGYGNSWHDILALRVEVADPLVPATVHVTASLDHDTEPGYDYTRLSYRINDAPGFVDVASWDGAGSVSVDHTWTYLPGDYRWGREVYIAWRVQSDGGWSDEDCAWPTAGACQVDDVTVTVTQAGHPAVSAVTDFDDGTFGAWEIAYQDGVGDFAQIWHRLRDADPCVENTSHQVAFIDDGLVVPGTGGSFCISWCYGPNGHIVNTTGGLAGPASKIANCVLSPVMPWPGGQFSEALLEFDAYIHEDFGPSAPWIYGEWSVRSADTDGSGGQGAQTITTQPWRNRGFILWGEPSYSRISESVSDLLTAGADSIQVRLGVFEEPGWHAIFNDGYPAPYYDNVSVKAFAATGPRLMAEERHLAQDGFPSSGDYAVADLANLSVRFDMARNISPASHLRIDPGDSIIVSVGPGRPGAALYEPPELIYVINPNPLFAAYRTTPISGVVPGALVAPGTGGDATEKWAFDLPDTGTLFPGDVMHYFVRAADVLGSDVKWAYLPADRAGYGDFYVNSEYDPRFVVRALPSLRQPEADSLAAPALLFWNDAPGRGGDAAWFSAFANLGLANGIDFDIYTTRAPGTWAGNGLGGRATPDALQFYDTLIYTSGDLAASTLSSYLDGENDIAVLTAWLNLGGRNVLFTGDGLASDLHRGTAGQLFLAEVLGLEVDGRDVQPNVDGQSSPLVLGTTANPVFPSGSTWLISGDCPRSRKFDGVVRRPEAVSLAVFGDPSGADGGYGYSAATLNIYQGTNRVISLPYDLASIFEAEGDKEAAPLPSRVVVLAQILDFFGHPGGGAPAGVPMPSERFVVEAAPNPFNPLTRISYTIPAPGALRIAVYDVRGALVRVLHDGPARGDGFVEWDGTDNHGRAAGGGIYLYEARSGGQIEVGKLTLVR